MDSFTQARLKVLAAQAKRVDKDSLLAQARNEPEDLKENLIARMSKRLCDRSHRHTD